MQMPAGEPVLGIFGGDHEILANNIAWILRHIPIFAIPGNGRYAVQPVHIDDLVQMCLDR
jgi:NADH dehydrogenase